MEIKLHCYCGRHSPQNHSSSAVGMLSPIRPTHSVWNHTMRQYGASHRIICPKNPWRQKQNTVPTSDIARRALAAAIRIGRRLAPSENRRAGIRGTFCRGRTCAIPWLTQ